MKPSRDVSSDSRIESRRNRVLTIRGTDKPMQRQRLSDLRRTTLALRKRLLASFNEPARGPHGAQAAAWRRYAEIVTRAIGQAWRRPARIPGDLACTLLVRLGPGGKVLDARIVLSSGNTAFDRSAARAMLMASPLADTR